MAALFFVCAFLIALHAIFPTPPFATSVEAAPAPSPRAVRESGIRQILQERPIRPFTSPPGFDVAVIHDADDSIKQTLSRTTTSEHDGDENISSDTREAGIAYFLQIANSTMPLLPRLLNRLHHAGNVYAIHFDRKISSGDVMTMTNAIRAEGRYANVHIMSSELITYRGVSMLLNTINAMRLLLDVGHWDYFINLSGADYPLLDVRAQRQLLGHQLGLNFFSFAPRHTWNGMAENRLSELWFDESLAFLDNVATGSLTRLEVRNPLVDSRKFEVSHAEAWMVLSRDYTSHIVRADRARKMLLSFAYSADASEHYFASLAWNDKDLKQTIVPHSLRMVVWMRDGVLAGQHPYFVDEMMEGETGFKFVKEVQESVLFFARKFQKKDSGLMDVIDERAGREETVQAARDHLLKKIASREQKLEEL